MSTQEKIKAYLVQMSIFMCLLLVAFSAGCRLDVQQVEPLATRSKTGVMTRAVGQSPLDNLDPSRIPPYERFDWQPAELVAVLGEHRGRHWGQVYSVAFSPDGKLIASGGADKVVRLWDAETLHERGALKGHKASVSSVAFSPDGKTLASGSLDQTVRLWELTQHGPEEKPIILKHQGYSIKVNEVAFAPDGKTLAAALTNGTVSLWDLGGPHPTEQAVINAGYKSVLTIAFSPDGKTLASGDKGGHVKLWDLSQAMPKKPSFSLPKHPGPVVSVAFAPDGRTLASLGSYGRYSLKLWDLTGATPKKTAGLGDYGRQLAFSPDGKTLVSGTILWDLTEAAPQWRYSFYESVDWSRFAHDPVPDEVTAYRWVSVAFAPDGNTLVSTRYAQFDDHSLHLWDLTGDKPREKIKPQGLTVPVVFVEFGPDSKALASKTRSDPVRLWDVSGTTPRELGVLQNQGLPIAFAPDGKMLASAQQTSRIIRLWDLSEAGIKERRNMLSVPGWVSAMAFGPQGKVLAIAYETKDPIIELWDLTKPPFPRELIAPTGHLYKVSSLAFSPNGETLASETAQPTYFGTSRLFAPKQDPTPIRLWDLSQPRPRELAALEGPRAGHKRRGVYSLVFAPNGTILASDGKKDITIRLWDLSAKRPKEQALLQGHTNEVIAKAFSPTGNVLISADAEGRIIFWEVASGKIIRDWELPYSASSIAFAHDGRHLATGNPNGTVYILRLASPHRK